VPLFAVCLPELFLGNVHALFALVLIYGFLRPGLWALPLLTKVTPAVGFIWLAARREWRKFGMAAAWTAGIIAVSAAIDPGAWVDWMRFLLHNADGGARSYATWTVVHYTLAAVLLTYAIRRERPRLLVPVVLLAAPVATYFAPLAILAALPRMRAPNDEGSPREPRRRDARDQRTRSEEDLKAGGVLIAEPEHALGAHAASWASQSVQSASRPRFVDVAHAEPRPVREVLQDRRPYRRGHSCGLRPPDTASVGAVGSQTLHSHDSAGEP
jgi:hypothetical protein